MLSSKGNLLIHQKTTKFCLKIQQKNGESKYQCPGCKKTFRRKDNYDRHTESCKAIDTVIERRKLREQVTSQSQQIEQLEKLLLQKNENIERLTDRIQDLATCAIARPTMSSTTNNKQVINLGTFDLTPEKAKAIFDREYNESYFLDGPKGLARFVNNHVLKTEKGETIYACFDASRCVFKYKNEDGSYIKDIKAKKLVEIIYPSALAHGDLMVAKFSDEYFNIVRTEEDHDTVKVAELRSNLATDAYLDTRRLKSEPEPFANELASLTAQ